MTSVALITAVTLSPFFRPISSALRLVITDSTTLSPTFTVISAVTVPRITSVISPFRWLRALSAIEVFSSIFCFHVDTSYYTPHRFRVIAAKLTNLACEARGTKSVEHRSYRWCVSLSRQDHQVVAFFLQGNEFKVIGIRGNSKRNAGVRLRRCNRVGYFKMSAVFRFIANDSIGTNAGRL